MYLPFLNWEVLTPGLCHLSQGTREASRHLKRFSVFMPLASGTVSKRMASFMQLPNSMVLAPGIESIERLSSCWFAFALGFKGHWFNLNHRAVSQGEVQELQAAIVQSENV